MSPGLHESKEIPSETPQLAHQVQDDAESIRSVCSILPPNTITHVPSHMSHVEPVQQYTSHVEVPDEIYNRFSDTKKLSIVAILSVCSFLTPISSTTVLAAVPEVAADVGFFPY